MQYLLCLLLCIYGSGTYAQESNEQEKTTIASHAIERDTVDLLLDDARLHPEEQAPALKPVSCVEFWLKRVGTCILINCIAFKNYIAQCVQERGHEKKDNN
jgi:hypothetical protein